MSNSPTLSVIIPVYNEEKYLQKCIQSLLKQTYPLVEIIVVDDGSSDSTLAIAKKLPVTLLTQEHLGAGAARNLGASQAKGEILIFVDADMYFDTKFLEKLTQPIRDSQTKGTFSKEEYVANMDNYWARGWSWIRGFKNGRMHPEDYPDNQPVFRAIRAAEFNRVNGFDPHRGYDDDWSLSERLGYQATNAPGAVFYHHNPASIEEVFFQAKWLSKRKYKLGVLGKMINLVRASWPVSLTVGALIAFKSQDISILPVKLVYDIGISVGILESLLSQKKGR